MAEVQFPHLHVSFYMDAVEDKAASRELSRPVYKDVEMVRIKFVGDTKNEHCAPAHEKFRQNPEGGDHLTYAQFYANHYKAFQEEEHQSTSGTPLTELPFLSRSKRAELKAMNIHNAEGLIALNHAALKRLGMGGREMVEQARVWMEDADKSASVTKVNAENAELKERMAKLEAMLSGQTGISEAPATGPESWDDERLRAYLTDQGAPPRANAARDKMIDAAREFMSVEAA